jgi:hypothetical protein
VQLHECFDSVSLDLTCATRAAVLGYFWSYIRAVEMGQVPAGCFSNTQLALPYSKLFSEEAAEKVHVFYLMKDEVLMRTWRPLDVICQIVIPEE